MCHSVAKRTLGYLKEWEHSVKEKSDLEAQEQNRLILFRETREGLKITGTYTFLLRVLCSPVNAFIEITKYVLSCVADDEPLYFLSGRISQDPIGNYFGEQRARGGRNGNPNLH